ncbi:MAG: RimK family alpha-L-glutamate ligase [Planctomycetes bacterium]|nr:RimK family alpha-L-glutamate ligase [Planctomycetota bacterium]
MLIAVLGSLESWYLKDITRAAVKRGHTVIGIPFRQLHGMVAQAISDVQAPVDSDAIKRFHRSAARRNTNSRQVPISPALLSSRGTHEMFSLSDVDAVLVRTMPPGSLEQVVYRMDTLHSLQGTGVPVVNPPRALETAVDKYLSGVRLGASGLLVPRTAVCETQMIAMDSFDSMNGDVVVKPIFGSEGRGITRVTDKEMAYRVFSTLERIGAVIFQQEFIPHFGYDVRAMVLDGRVVAAMRRRSTLDWRTNVSRGAKAEPATLSNEEEQIAVQAANAVGATLAGVDLLPARDGSLYVVEVNAVPGWRATSRVSNVDISDTIVEYLSNIQVPDSTPS